jgi:hypothetical protein
LGTGYAAAERHMNTAEPSPAGYQQRATESLDKVIDGFEAIEAPMAVQSMLRQPT